MLILQSKDVSYCPLTRDVADSPLPKIPGLEYDHKLYVKDETYYQRDRQTAIQAARQKLLDLKGQSILLVEDGETITLWYHDKTVQKANPLFATDLQQLVATMRDVGGIQIKDRQFHLKTYQRCFVGSEAVDWLMAHLSISRKVAVQMGQRLIDEQWIHHVLDEQAFQDDYFFYRFRWDEQ